MDPNPEIDMPDPYLPDKSDDYIRQLAIDTRAGRVFGTWMFQNNETAQAMTPYVFMALNFSNPPAPNVVQLYEYLDRAGPRRVNGYPIFFSYRCLTQGDVDRLNATIKALADAEHSVRYPQVQDPLATPPKHSWWHKLLSYMGISK